MNHQGADVKPRKIMTAEDKNVVIEANSPGYSPVLIEGVFLGILEMCGIKTGRVDYKEENGNSIYYITWQINKELKKPALVSQVFCVRAIAAKLSYAQLQFW